MGEVIDFEDCRDRKEKFDERLFNKFRYDFYDQFMESLKGRYNKLVCWNPLSNQEIELEDWGIDIFSAEVEEFSNQQNVFIHLGKQWLKQYDYDYLTWHGAPEKRWICGFDYYPNSEGFMHRNAIRRFYYMLVKPTVITSFCRPDDGGMVDLFYYDETNRLIDDDDNIPSDDILNRAVSYTFLNG